MITEITKFGGYTMAMNERKELLYLSASSKTRVVHPGTLEVLEILPKVKHGYPTISNDGNYVAFFNSGGEFMVYRVGTPHELLLSKRWKNCSTDPYCIAFCNHDSEVIVGIKNTVYSFNILTEKENILFRHENEDCWIFTLSCYRDNIVLYFRNFSENNRFIVRYSDYPNTPPQIMAVQDWRIYHVLFDAHGNITTFQGNSGHEMSIYTNDCTDFSHPEKVIQSPLLGRPRFSSCGRWLTFLSLEPNNFSSALLYSTETWELIATAPLRTACYVDFSTNGNFWLIGSDKPMFQRIG